MRNLKLFLAAALLGLSAPALAQKSPVISPSQRIAGASQEEWTRLWWQWAMSFEASESPVADETGEFCASRQSGEVWFLAGTFGTRRAERRCKVPQGKILFFPLINYLLQPPEGQRIPCQALMDTVARVTQSPSALVLELDGVRGKNLRSHRQATKGCFALDVGEPPVAAANGYYIALRPLPVGVHVLNFGGILPSFSQAVTYTLVVE